MRVRFPLPAGDAENPGAPVELTPSPMGWVVNKQELLFVHDLVTNP